MRTGYVPLLWALREHKAWAQPAYDDLVAEETAPARPNDGRA
jgi:hypothetical protein